MPFDEKATALIPSVGADGGQPISQNTNQSIADGPAEINHDLGFEEISRQMRQYNAPGYMRTFTMNELYENVYDSRPPIVDGLLYAGTYLFVGAPKVGKSFFMAQLAYHVSMGIRLWDYEVKKGTVLYLALEDTEKRLQECLFRMILSISVYTFTSNNWNGWIIRIWVYFSRSVAEWEIYPYSRDC